MRAEQRSETLSEYHPIWKIKQERRKGNEKGKFLNGSEKFWNGYIGFIELVDFKSFLKLGITRNKKLQLSFMAKFLMKFPSKCEILLKFQLSVDFINF